MNPFCLADQTGTFTNSIDPDEMVQNEPSHLDLHCLPFCSYSLTDTIFAIMDSLENTGERVNPFIVRKLSPRDLRQKP